MRIIITGGTGLIGRPLSAALIAQNHEVTVLTRDPIEADPTEEASETMSVTAWSKSCEQLVLGDVANADFYIILEHTCIHEKINIITIQMISVNIMCLYL